MVPLRDLVAALHRDAASEDGGGAHRHAEAIARRGDDAAVSALIGVLQHMATVDLSDDGGDGADECWRASSAAAHGLGQLGQLAVSPLLAILDGPPSRARGYAARALGTIGDPRALAPLVAMATAGPDDASERRAALAALGTLGQHAALPTLRAALAPTAAVNDAHIRATAAIAIGMLHDADSCALLCSLLADREWYVRYHACEGLEHLGTAEARAGLELALRDSDARVAGRARAAISELRRRV